MIPAKDRSKYGYEDMSLFKAQGPVLQTSPWQHKTIGRICDGLPPGLAKQATYPTSARV